jgi:hypothetical protein
MSELSNPIPLDGNKDLAFRWLGSVADGNGQYTHHFEVNDLDGPKPGIYKVTYSTRTEVAHCEADKSTAGCRHAVTIFNAVNGGRKNG